MTTQGNEQGAALSDDDARQDAAQQEVQAPEPNAPSPAPIDPDEAELLAARAAVAAEEAGTGTEGQQQPPAAAQTPSTPPQTQQQPGQKAAPPPVPYERFSEQNRKLREAQDRASYLEGALAATRNGNPAPAGQPAPQPAAPAAPVDTAASLKAELLAKAKEFDSGAITLEAYEEARLATWDKIQALQQPAAQPAASRQPSGLVDEMVEQAHLDELGKRYPEASTLSDQQAEMLAGMAEQMAKVGGGVFPGTNQKMTGHPVRDTIILRESVAFLARANAAALGLRASAPAAAQPSTRQQQATPQPLNLSPDAKARQAKMAMAANLPPDPSGMGMAAASDLSASQIASMDDEAIMALPAQARARILASTG